MAMLRCVIVAVLVATPQSAFGFSRGTMDGERIYEGQQAKEEEEEREEEERRVIGAFRESFAQASVAPGGSVYDQQEVRGLSDADPDAPLVASLHLSRSGRVVNLGGGGGGVDVGVGGNGDDDGDVDSIGRVDVHRSFLAQSCFKPLTYAMALEMGLGDEVKGAVGCTGDVGFGTFDREPPSRGGRAFNPLINSGALVVLERLSRTHTIDEVGRWCRGIGSGGEDADDGGGSTSPSPSPLLFDTVAVRATEDDSLRNRGLGCSLASAGLIPKTDDAVDRAVRYYAAMDCLRTDCAGMASVAAAFAGPAGPADGGGRGGGVDGSSPPRLVLDPPTRSAVLATMLHCGMYEESGTWARDVGVPAKSGVSGAVWASITGVGGICAHQPRIDGRGNSVQAMALIRGMVALEPSISVFHP